MKRKFVIFLLIFFNCTWGIFMTLLGAITTMVCLALGGVSSTFGPCLYTKIGKNWGGLEMGSFFLTDDNPGYSTKCHETGHSIQNAFLGPLMPFLVSIPSAFRYWLREFKTIKTMSIYSGVCCGILMVVAAIPFACGLGFSILGLTVFGAFLMAYVICLACWSFFYEIPQYKEKRPLYDDFIVEGTASKWGEAFMKKYYPNIR